MPSSSAAPPAERPAHLDRRIFAAGAWQLVAVVLLGVLGPIAPLYRVAGTSGQEALAWGLVSEVVDTDAVVERTQERAAELATLPTRAIAMTKRLFRRAATSRLEDQLELEAQLQVAATRTDDFAEGVAAFLEKREPRFSGR